MQTPKTYKHLTFLTMLYMTIKLITVVLIYKVIAIGPFTASVSTLVMPFWFILGDIVAEVYGYPTAKKMIWIALVCQFIFTFTCALLVSFNSPPLWLHQEAYTEVLSKLPRVAFASSLAVIAGAFINAYAVSKWKIVLSGKYFWLRSLGASAIGELVFTIVAYFTEFTGITSYYNILKLMAISYVVKLMMNFILVIPALFTASALKKSEGIDVYDYGVDYNPFKPDVDANENKNEKTIDSISESTKDENSHENY